MVYNGNPYSNGWFGGSTIFGNIHMVNIELQFNLESQYSFPSLAITTILESESGMQLHYDNYRNMEMYL